MENFSPSVNANWFLFIQRPHLNMYFSHFQDRGGGHSLWNPPGSAAYCWPENIPLFLFFAETAAMLFLQDILIPGMDDCQNYYTLPHRVVARGMKDLIVLKVSYFNDYYYRMLLLLLCCRSPGCFWGYGFYFRKKLYKH